MASTGIAKPNDSLGSEQRSLLSIRTPESPSGESISPSSPAQRRMSRLGSASLASSPLSKWITKDDKEIQKLRAAAAARSKTIEIEQEEQRQLREFHSELQSIMKWLALLTVVTISLAVVINEACASDDYQEFSPSELDLDEIEQGAGRQCASAYGEPLKFVGTALTVVVVCLIVKRHGIKLHLRLTKRRHLKSELPTTHHASTNNLSESGAAESPRCGMPWVLWFVRRSSTKCKLWLLLEVLVCSAHQFPGVRQDVKVHILGERMFYRFESISCGVMMLRLYHIWRWVYISAYLHYFDMNHTFVVQDHATIHLMREGAVRKRRLAIKVGVSRHPLKLIALAIVLLVVVISYLIRIAEGPANQPHSHYYWDQMWLTITQGTTGYGDSTPQTHLGRFFSVVMMFCGPIFVAFVTASVTRFLEMSAEDQAVVRRMDENRLKSRLLEAAALLLQNWFRTHRQRQAQFEILHASRHALPHQRSWRSRVTLQLHGQTRHAELLKHVYLASERLRKFRARHKSALSAPPPPTHSGGAGREGDVLVEVRRVMAAVREVGERVKRVEDGMSAMAGHRTSAEGRVGAAQEGRETGSREEVGLVEGRKMRVPVEAKEEAEEATGWNASQYECRNVEDAMEGGRERRSDESVTRLHLLPRSPFLTPRSPPNLLDYRNVGVMRQHSDEGKRGGRKGREERGKEWAAVEAELVMLNGDERDREHSDQARRETSPLDAAPPVMEPTPRLANPEQARARAMRSATSHAAHKEKGGGLEAHKEALVKALAQDLFSGRQEQRGGGHGAVWGEGGRGEERRRASVEDERTRSREEQASGTARGEAGGRGVGGRVEGGRGDGEREGERQRTPRQLRRGRAGVTADAPSNKRQGVDLSRRSGRQEHKRGRRVDGEEEGSSHKGHGGAGVGVEERDHSEERETRVCTQIANEPERSVAKARRSTNLKADENGEEDASCTAANPRTHTPRSPERRDSTTRHRDHHDHDHDHDENVGSGSLGERPSRCTASARSPRDLPARPRPAAVPPLFHRPPSESLPSASHHPLHASSPRPPFPLPISQAASRLQALPSAQSEALRELVISTAVARQDIQGPATANLKNQTRTGSTGTSAAVPGRSNKLPRVSLRELFSPGPGPSLPVSPEASPRRTFRPDAPGPAAVAGSVNLQGTVTKEYLSSTM